MPHSQTLVGVIGKLAQGQLAPSGGDPALTQDDGSVMQRAVLEKEAGKQHVGYFSVDAGARFHHRLQAHLALQHDEGPGAVARERFGHLGQRIGQGRVLRAHKGPQQGVATQHEQPATQFRLKQDHHRQKAGGHQVIQHPGQDRQVENRHQNLRGQIDPGQQHPQPPDKTGPAGAAQQADHPVKSDGQKRDLDEITP